MRYEIRDRINTIIENDTGLQSGGNAIFQTFTAYPTGLNGSNLPSVIALPRQGQPYQYSGGNRFSSDVEFDIRVYLAPAGTRLKTINDIEALTFPDLFADAFLSRPQLQYNDSALSGVSGNLEFQIASDLARLIEYPVGVSGAPRYWGFIARLSIPYRQIIQMKVRGT